MDEINLLCDVAVCGRIARVFGIKGKTKEKYCQDHIELLTNKRMSAYDIVAYHFISSFEDVPIYEERRNMMERGLGNLTVLEAQLDSELFEAQRLLEDNEKKAIAIVVRSYREIRLQVQGKCEASKQQLQAMRHNFEQYLVSKQNELQGNAPLLCRDGISPLKFLRLVAEDCMIQIAKAILGSWRVSKEDVDATIPLLDENKRTAFLQRLTTEAIDELKKGHAQLSLQLNQYAHALGWKGDLEEAKRMILIMQVERVIELQKMFQLATYVSDVEKALMKSIAIDCFQAGITAKKRLDILQSFNWLKNAWDLLKKSKSTGKEMTVVGLVLSEVVGLYFGKYLQAESILRHCYDIETQSDSLSEDEMKVSNSIAGVFYHSGSWNNAVDMCRWVLHAFSSTSHAAEHFWTTLHYLTHSYWLQGKNAEAQTVVEEWQSKSMARENEHSEVLKLTVIAQYAQEQSNHAEAEKLLIKAAVVAGQHFPTSVLAALDYRLLGRVYYDLKRFTEAEEQYRKAKAIYEAVSPHSVHAAITFHSMGLLYTNLKLFSEAKTHYKKAKLIYEAVSPQSLLAANNLCNLGRLYYNLKRFSEAEEHYKKAKAFYDKVSPQSVSAANNIYNLGLLYEAMRKIEDALSAFRAAQTIYIDIHLVSDAKDAENAISRLQSGKSILAKVFGF